MSGRTFIKGGYRRLALWRPDTGEVVVARDFAAAPPSHEVERVPLWSGARAVDREEAEVQPVIWEYEAVRFLRAWSAAQAEVSALMLGNVTHFQLGAGDGLNAVPLALERRTPTFGRLGGDAVLLAHDRPEAIADSPDLLEPLALGEYDAGAETAGAWKLEATAGVTVTRTTFGLRLEVPENGTAVLYADRALPLPGEELIFEFDAPGSAYTGGTVETFWQPLGWGEGEGQQTAAYGEPYLAGGYASALGLGTGEEAEQAAASQTDPGIVFTVPAGLTRGPYYEAGQLPAWWARVGVRVASLADTASVVVVEFPRLGVYTPPPPVIVPPDPPTPVDIQNLQAVPATIRQDEEVTVFFDSVGAPITRVTARDGGRALTVVSFNQNHVRLRGPSLTPGASSGTFPFTGGRTIAVTAYGAGGVSDTETVALTVTPVAAPPDVTAVDPDAFAVPDAGSQNLVLTNAGGRITEVDSPATILDDEGTPYTITATLRYSSSDGTRTTVELSGWPTAAEAKEYSGTLVVRNDDGSDAVAFSVVVTVAPAAPVISNLQPSAFSVVRDGYQDVTFDNAGGAVTSGTCLLEETPFAFVPENASVQVLNGGGGGQPGTVRLYNFPEIGTYDGSLTLRNDGGSDTKGLDVTVVGRQVTQGPDISAVSPNPYQTELDGEVLFGYTNDGGAVAVVGNDAAIEAADADGPLTVTIVGPASFRVADWNAEGTGRTLFLTFRNAFGVDYVQVTGTVGEAGPQPQPPAISNLSPTNVTKAQNEGQNFTFDNGGDPITSITAVDDLGEQVDITNATNGGFRIPSWPSQGQRTITLTFANGTAPAATAQIFATVNPPTQDPTRYYGTDSRDLFAESAATQESAVTAMSSRQDANALGSESLTYATGDYGYWAVEAALGQPAGFKINNGLAGGLPVADITIGGTAYKLYRTNQRGAGTITLEAV